MPARCPWSESHELLLDYHDTEWGVPLHDDRRIFEFLVLESFQAGLSWVTILKKRENFRKSFNGFDPESIAGYGDEDISRLMGDEGIIRNRQKITATIRNARAFLELSAKKGSFASWMWDFVDGTPIVNRWDKETEIPPESDLSMRVSKELKKNGFSFLGSVVVYSHMQDVGMINDHLTGCFRYAGLSPSVSRVSSSERSSIPASDST